MVRCARLLRTNAHTHKDVCELYNKRLHCNKEWGVLIWEENYILKVQLDARMDKKENILGETLEWKNIGQNSSPIIVSPFLIKIKYLLFCEVIKIPEVLFTLCDFLTSKNFKLKNYCLKDGTEMMVFDTNNKREALFCACCPFVHV